MGVSRKLADSTRAISNQLARAGLLETQNCGTAQQSFVNNQEKCSDARVTARSISQKYSKNSLVSHKMLILSINRACIRMMSFIARSICTSLRAEIDAEKLLRR